MNAIDLMKEEHRYIERMLKVIREVSLRILKGEKVEYDDLYSIIGFVREYADGHHHNKEEVLLFNRMIENLGSTGEVIVRNGMLVEHDLGRLYIKNLEEAIGRLKDGSEDDKLDIIANLISYTDLLKRHIDKEDNVVYNFAVRGLKEEILIKLDDECIKYEAENEAIKVKNISLLESLEKKYLF
ncbi:hemerythrin domain-containing protein [uncultured Clostridium sp.]|uniref:hemerythrin domain-containing protein n=1 Tax=uncultured Clostridium sp. TaxID=59620 RepID=UPI0025EC8162|nr:hemerythrin domain-containing protein [uncultured Clostridium sp.]